MLWPRLPPTAEGIGEMDRSRQGGRRVPGRRGVVLCQQIRIETGRALFAQHHRAKRASWTAKTSSVRAKTESSCGNWPTIVKKCVSFLIVGPPFF